VTSADALTTAVKAAGSRQGPHFIRLHTRASEGVMPPRIPWPAETIAARFSDALSERPASLIDKTALADAE
jgi:hypothetical protein